MERPQGSSSLKIGDKAPYFSLPATDGKIYTLSDFSESAALVVIFTGNHCPVAQAYEKRLKDLSDTYKARGVDFISICSNDAEDFPEDSFERMIEKSKSMNFCYPYLHDATQVVARAFDAACTPEVFLFNNQLSLSYHGAIDDNQIPSKVTRQYLKEAIEAVLSQSAPKATLTPVFGCTIKWKD